MDIADTSALPGSRVTTFSRTKQTVGLVAWLLLSALAALGGAVFARADSFYRALTRPSWAPPPEIFSPVWTTLYVLMGVAAWLVWRVGGSPSGSAGSAGSAENAGIAGNAGNAGNGASVVRDAPPVRAALIVYVAQLALNALWTFLFFGWRQGALAFVDILAMWGLIVATLVLFWRVRPVAGALLIPYLLWVSYAAALNYAVWQLNPQQLG